MCGITGYVAPIAPSSDPLERMAGTLVHRGPDSGGYHRRADRAAVAMAVRRLRIIDLITGDQPITSLCTGATIVYNGELYNYRELRAELEAKGHRFRTGTDTEVVLHFYEELGTAEMHRLNGIFAFAIDDPRTGSVVLVRDQLGVKPLYVAQPGRGVLVFGSEPKAILASGLVAPRVDRDALASYLTYGHAVGQRSIFEGIRKVPPGHALRVAPEGTALERYWDLVARARVWPEGSPVPREELDALLADAVRRNMIADVPVGAFLSGGIDSSLVTALMRKFTPHLRTYSVGFGGANDELPDALRVASALGTTHTAITMTGDDAARHLSDVARAYDEPFADAAALPTYLVAKRAREDVTVVLTGEGGDELFGGYRRYVGEQAFAPFRVIPSGLRVLLAMLPAERLLPFRRVGRVLRALATDDRAERFSVWTETFAPRDIDRLLGAHRPASAYYDPYRAVADGLRGVRDDVTAMMAVELQTWLVDAYLEKVDKATMAVSLEARVPLLDLRLVEMMAFAPRSWKIRGTETKVTFKEVAARHIPMQNVRKPKQGFGPPYAAWLRGALLGRVTHLGSSESLLSLVEAAPVQRIVRGFLRGEPSAAQVWSLLMLDEWARQQRDSAAV